MNDNKEDLIEYIIREENIIINLLARNPIIGLKTKYMKKLYKLSKEYPCYERGVSDLHRGSIESLSDLWNEMTNIRVEIEKDIDKAYFRKKKPSKSKTKRKTKGCGCK